MSNNYTYGPGEKRTGSAFASKTPKTGLENMLDHYFGHPTSVCKPDADFDYDYSAGYVPAADNHERT